MARILVIDDDQQIVKLLLTFLEFEGHSVVTATNGKEGLNVLATSSVDLIISDILMPEHDGLEVLMSISQMTNRPKVIAMTGGISSLDPEYLLEMAKALKADAVIPKPVNLSVISDKIRELTVT